ncbi:serine/threonine-protein kinase Nek1-like, partial [Arapaima gigas]
MPVYVAPEVRKGKPFSKRSDVWALGRVLYELCTLQSAIKEPASPCIPENLSPELHTLVKDLLEEAPEKRPSVKQILRRLLVAKLIPEHLSPKISEKWQHEGPAPVVLLGSEKQKAENLLKRRGYTVTTEDRQGGLEKTVVKRHENLTHYVVQAVEMKNVTEKDKERTIEYVKSLTQIKHPNIVDYRKSLDRDAGKLYIMMENCEHGDLAQKIKSQKESVTRFSEDQILDWFVQICLALKHIHDMDIVHKDLKPQNIFLTDDQTIKLGKFGLGKVLCRREACAEIQTEILFYASPEVWKGKPFTKKSDVWALGCLLYELCSLQFAFDPEDNIFFTFDLWNKPTPPHLSEDFCPELYSLVDELLQRDPEDRPTIDDILRKLILAEKIPKNLLRKVIEEVTPEAPAPDPVLVSDVRNAESLQKKGYTLLGNNKQGGFEELVVKCAEKKYIIKAITMKN